MAVPTSKMKIPPRPAAADRPAPPPPERASAFSPPPTAKPAETDHQTYKETGMASTRAPATSHIAQYGVSGSELYVTFKEASGGESDTFVYTLPSQEAAGDLYLQLHSSPHPYGQVLKPDVIDAGVPVYRI